MISSIDGPAAGPPTVAVVPGWSFVPVVLTWGVLSPLPFLVAAHRSGRRALYGVAAVYAAAVVGLMILGAQAGRDAAGDQVGDIHQIAVLAQIALVVVTLVHLVVLRRGGPVALPSGRDPAVLAALAGRRRRAEARAMAAADPMLARELRVGRPDLPHRYDDGGLVDLVSAPAAVIAGVCGVSATHADEVVRARDVAGEALRDVDDLALWITVPFAVWEQIRDRGIVLGLPRA